MNTLHPSNTSYLFDLGGVIFHLNYQKTYDAFQQLTGLDSQIFFNQYKQPELFDLYERGEIEEQDFIKKFQKIFSPNDLSTLSSTSIKTAWNAMLLHIPGENLITLEKLSKKHDLYLLSNTNKTHWDEVTLILEKYQQKERFYSCFKKVFLSFEIGMRKPEKQIFDYCQKQMGCALENIMFIDDNIDNINAAKSLGIKTLHYPKGNPLLKSCIQF